jgi:hypothetical protein
VVAVSAAVAPGVPADAVGALPGAQPAEAQPAPLDAVCSEEQEPDVPPALDAPEHWAQPVSPAVVPASSAAAAQDDSAARAELGGTQASAWPG